MKTGNVLKRKFKVINENQPDICVQNKCSNQPNEHLQTTPKKNYQLITDAPVGKSPKTPNFLYQEAKQMFRRCTTPKKLVGRQEEREKLEDFITKHVIGAKPGSMYISGRPGTGKTALFKEILESQKQILNDQPFPIHVLHVNCMNMSDSTQIYSHLIQEWHIKSQSKDLAGVLSSFFVPKNTNAKTPMYCLILDEIDQLVTKEKDVLYAFFEWAKIPDSRLVLFGIANQLDLTTRFLPRLVTKNCEPEYLSFDPYKVNEISAIIKDRLQSLDDSPHTPSKKVDQNGKSILPVMQPMAVEMAARKLAGTGDLRKALDVCLQAIQLVETEAAKSENENAMVTVKHILTAATAMLGSPIINRMKELTLQAKLVLVAIVILIRNNKGQLTTFKLEQAHRSICNYKKKMIGRIVQSEFFDILNQLESLAIIHLQIKKRNNKTETMVTLNVNPEEVLEAVSHVPIIKDILENADEAIQGPKK